MKKKHYIITMLLLLLLLASCNSEHFLENSSGSNKELVKVVINEINTKALSMTYPKSSMEYRLTTEPLFKRGQSTIVGTVTDSKVTKSGSYYYLGYFEQGLWKFKIDGVITIGETSAVIASKEFTQYITKSTSELNVALEDACDPNKKGKIDLQVNVPKLSDSADNVSLKIYVDGNTEPESYVSAPQVMTMTDTDGYKGYWSVEGTLDNIPEGYHNLKFEYLDGDVSVAKQNIEVRIIGNMTTTVSGYMVNVKSSEEKLYVSYPTDSWSIKITTENSTFKPGEDIVFTCELTGAAQAEYQWYMNGEKLSNRVGSTYTFCTGVPDNYSVTCVVKVNGAYKSDTYELHVLK